MTSNESNVTSKVTTFIQAQPLAMEKYVWEIKLSENIMSQDLISSPVFATTCNFPSGVLAQGNNTSSIRADFDRNNRQVCIALSVNKIIKCKKIVMLPMLVEILANGQIICHLEEEMANASKSLNCCTYNKYLDLPFSEKQANEVDTIRITLNIKVQENSPRVTVLETTPIEDLEKDKKVPTMQQLLSNFYKSDYLSDVTIACEEEKAYPCHKIILALSSPVFKTMFETDMQEKVDGRIFITDLRKHTVEQMLEWIYTGRFDSVPVDLQHLVDLFKAAHRYEIVSLKAWCILQIAPNICADNATDMYELWETFKVEALTQRAVQVMKCQKAKVFKTLAIWKDFANKYPEVMFEIM